MKTNILKHILNILLGYGIVYCTITLITCDVNYWALPLLCVLFIIYYMLYGE